MKVAPDDFFSYFQDLCSQTEKDAYVTVQETQETDPIATAFPSARRTNIQQRDHQCDQISEQ